MAEVHYIIDSSLKLEFILCSNSMISYPLHNHVSVFSVGMILEGSISLHLNGKNSIYDKNKVFVIPPYAAHEIAAERPYSMLTICIPSYLLPLREPGIYSEAAAILDSYPPGRPLDVAQIDQLVRTIQQLSQPQTDPFLSMPHLYQIARQLEIHANAKYTVESMAKTAFMSKFHFIREFKKATGLTPHQFHIQNRIRMAQKLLVQPLSLTEAALNAGFYDQSHFIKQFEYTVGLTPAVYKRSCHTQ